MKPAVRLGVVSLAVMLAMPVNTWLANRVYAQSGSEKLSEQQYQELQQKRQEQWQDQEMLQKRLETGQRRQEGEKRTGCRKAAAGG